MRLVLNLPPRSGARLATGLLGILTLAPGPIQAQDGQLPTTDPDLGTRRPTLTREPRNPAEVLPAVPASPSDPAPPGTRAVPIPPEPGNRPSAHAVTGQVAQPGNRAARRIQAVEGVVVAIHPPRGGESRPTGELIRLVIDPDQAWHDYAVSGPQHTDRTGPAQEPAAGSRPAPARDNQVVPTRDPAVPPAPVPGPGTTDPGGLRALPPQQATPADAAPAAPAPDQRASTAVEPVAAQNSLPPRAFEVIVTRGTRVAVHARSPEGTDLFGVASVSSPVDRPTGTGASARGLAPPAGPRQTNFTNIRVGSFVAVRYLMVENAAYALNLNLIELPLLGPDEAGPGDPGLQPGVVPAGPGGVRPAPTPTVDPTPPGTDRDLIREAVDPTGRRPPVSPGTPQPAPIPNTPSAPASPN